MVGIETDQVNVITNQSMSCDPSILAVLTEDLLIRVNERLADDDSALKAWRLVCKDFHRVDSLTRRTLRVLHVEFLFSLLQNYTNIHTLDLSVCPRVDDGTVSMLLVRGGDGGSLGWTRKLKSLNLSRATGLRFSGLEMMVRACGELEAIDVSYCCGFGDREAAAVSVGGGLREVRMDKCLEVSDVGLANVAVGCGRLEKLSLKWCMEISDLGIDLLCKKCKELRFLDVSYLKVTDKGMEFLGHLEGLSDLELRGLERITGAGLTAFLARNKNLTYLDLKHCRSIDDSGFLALAYYSRNLRQIGIEG
ncbi:hypothetical protein Tsubulata_033246 [Turnera subulata]|uniref:F-box/LRR-repeat protein 15-like leucin rich repeat domain-containing protein n=1 Tax=Turnera subulata TaxID=218843 RepID=A0A9Q0J8B1_9ROSI|nr:hypothetical protein Tsubulata_033246 [Turnera subulata]